VKKKVRPRKALIAELDRLFSLYIRWRDGRCVQCGATENLTCGHLFSRAHYRTRWDEKNAAAQCAGHNLRHEHDFYPFEQYFVNKYGREAVDSLHRLWITPIRLSRADLEDLVTYWRGRVVVEAHESAKEGA
jgi:hypothetical protein